MSSHHFVKENQEPFLFVKGNDFPIEVLNQLLEWNPSVICDQNSISYFFQNNRKADYLFLDSPSLVNIFNNLNVELVITENKSISEKLTEFLAIKKSNYLNVVCENVVEEFNNFSKDFYSILNVYFFDAKNKLYKNPSKNFSKWQNKGQKTSILDTNGIEIESFTALEEGVFCFPPLHVYWILESI